MNYFLKSTFLSFKIIQNKFKLPTFDIAVATHLWPFFDCICRERNKKYLQRKHFCSCS